MGANKKTLNREVFEGSDLLGLRLRAAKKPAVIPFLEIPPEEIDVEPITLDPVDLTEAEPVSISPLTLSQDEILPYDDEEDEANNEPPRPVDTSTVLTDKPATKSNNNKSSSNSLSLFGVGEIETKSKPRKRT